MSVDNPGQDTNQVLKAAFALGVLSNSLGEATAQALRLVGMAILARALDPSDFGLYRLLLVVIGISQLLVELGVPEAMIQRRELEPDRQAAGFWLIGAGTILVVCGLASGGGLLARILGTADQAWQYRILAVPAAFWGLGALPSANLRRQMRFGALALAEATGEAAFLMAALVALFVIHRPREALLTGLCARFITEASMLAMAGAMWPQVPPSGLGIRQIGAFAAPVCAGRLFVNLSANLDFVLIARLLGTGPLGYYAIAWDLLRFIPNRLYRMVVRLTLPLFSRLQDDNSVLRTTYRNFVGTLARLELPLMACLAILADPIVKLIYSARWEPAAPLLQLLTPGLTFAALSLAMGSVFCSKGRPAMDIYLNGLRIALIALTVVTLARFGLLAISAGMSTVEGLTGLMGQFVACALIEERLARLMKEVLPGLGLALACGGLCWGASTLLGTNVGAWVRILISLGLAAAAYGLLQRAAIRRFANRISPLIA
ncbi:MAG TPA: oligosaccharide flippase family protein [Candidatus Binataceae bacterium]|nr:oligosaccharide flippase family protein [Candidatus Binataceae bacterium]